MILSAIPSMKCHLILDERGNGWIIDKMCRRLGDELQSLGCDVTIGGAARPDVDINHFMLFWWMAPGVPGHSTVAITHIDDSYRLNLARSAVKNAELAICMSSMTAKQLVNDGLDRSKLCYVLPALDPGIQPRRIVIGLTTKLYPDGRKREFILVRLAKEMDLTAFHFDIFGSGWQDVAAVLRQSGATVVVTEDSGDMAADYRLMQERIPCFDYYLYTGLDEGSMGTLDALSAGVKTIVTPQGFHVDLPDGITHPFWEYAELLAVFEQIRNERERRVRTVRDLSWRRYAERHHFIWRVLLEGRRAELPQMLGQESFEPLGGYTERMDQHMDSERRRLLARSIRRYGILHRFRSWKLTHARNFLGRWAKTWLPEPVSRRLFHVSKLFFNNKS